MNNIETQYFNLLKDILENGTKKEDRTGTGTISIFGRQIRHKMSEGFPLLTTKKMPFKTITTELLWFLRGDTNIKYLVDNGCNIWNGDCYKYFKSTFSQMPGIQSSLPSQKEFIEKIKTDDNYAKKWGNLGPIYGRQWRAWGGYEKVPAGWHHGAPSYFQEKPILDQIANLINDLKTNPDSRRLIVTAWNPAELDQMVLPPCHYGFQVYTRELSFNERWFLHSDKPYDGNPLAISNTLDYLDDKNVPTRAISLMWNQRSVDTPLGLPFNIASYGLLLEIIANMVNMVPDELIGNLGDVHIYNNQIEGVNEQLNREQFELPKININTEFWPTEGGECGIGPIDTTAVLNLFYNDNFCKCLIEEDIQISNYNYHPAIKFPLSN